MVRCSLPDRLRECLVYLVQIQLEIIKIPNFKQMSSKSKKKKKSTKVKKDVKGISSNFSKFEDGQTEVELAQLRENMRELSKQVKEKRHALVDNIEETAREVDPDKETVFQAMQKKHDALFKQVNRTRELAQNIELHNDFGEIVLEQATKANNFAKLSTQRIIDKIKEKYAASQSNEPGETVEIDWVAMGRAASALFNAPPRTAFLHGAMMKNVVVKQKKKTTKRKRPTRDTKSKASRADVLDDLGGSDDKDDSVNLMKQVANTAIKINKAKRAKTDFLELVVDPKSFPRTVENWFAASFLIKQGDLHVEMGENGVPMAHAPKALGRDDNSDTSNVYQGPSQLVSEEVMQFSQAPEDGAESHEATRHCVVALNYHDWQKLCKAIEPSGQWEAQIERKDTDDEKEEESSEEEEEEEESATEDDSDSGSGMEL